MVVESTYGQTVVNTMASGKKIICTERVSTPGKMAECMKVITKTTESTAMESTPGTTESSTKAGGKMASSTAKASTEKMVATGEAFGKTARESNGSRMKVSAKQINERIIAFNFVKY